MNFIMSKAGIKIRNSIKVNILYCEKVVIWYNTHERYSFMKEKEHINKNEVVFDYYGYQVTKDGRIYNSTGERINLIGKGLVPLKIDGKRKTLLAGRVVYEAVSQQKITSYESVTRFKDGNPRNPAYENIEVISREKYYSEKVERKRSRDEKFVKDIMDAYTEKYSIEEKKEHHFRGEYGKPSIRELAKRFNTSVTIVNAVVKGNYYEKNYGHKSYKKKKQS